ncbi:MAG: ROK family transcriptional regulator [Chloroflexi bacterium]|nr:ROK family transcriptional regulator [Chloroflexota bacterium]
MVPKKATRQQTKEHNRDLVLTTIFDHKTVSRAEIARITYLTRTTVSNIVNFLIDEGLVKEVGLGESIGGKSPILLSLIADSRYLVGLNLAQDKFTGAIVNIRGEIKESVEIPLSNSNEQEALKLVYQILDDLLAKNRHPIIGIGVGTPGLINTKEGIVVNAVNLDWQDFPLAHLLNKRYNLPIAVLNDSQASAIGEYVYGGEHESDGNLIVVSVKQGLGAGILINGQLFQGDGGGAGEIGHVVMQKDGLLCRCGKRGCLETLASASAIVQRAKTLAPERPASSLANEIEAISLTSIESAFFKNDPLAQEIITEAGCYLGASIANLVSILNIEKIVLTGDLSRFGELWLQSVRDSMLQTALTKIAQDTKLEIGKIEFQSCILGASASMLMDGYALLFRSEE